MAVAHAASSSIALQRHRRRQLAPANGPCTHPVTHPGWLHCRTLLFDGQCFGEVAFFTEIPQLEFVRTVRCAACQHCQLCQVIARPSLITASTTAFYADCVFQTWLGGAQSCCGLFPADKTELDTCFMATGTGDAAEKQVLHLRHARTALCFTSCSEACSVSCILAVPLPPPAACSATKWLERPFAACAESWLCPEPRTTASRQPSPSGRGRC